MKRIKRFNIYQTAKVAAVIYFLISIVLVIPFFFFFSMLGAGNNPALGMFGGIGLLFVPFLYAGVAFVITAISCAIYNMVSRWTGGIEVEVDTVE